MSDLLQHFDRRPHLTDDQIAAIKPFSTLAHHLADTLPPGPEATMALGLLLEASDCVARTCQIGEAAR